MKHVKRTDIILLPAPRQMDFTGNTVRIMPPEDEPLPVRAVVDPAAVPHREGYHLTIGESGEIAIVAHDEAGAFYGRQTLLQLQRQAGKHGELPVGVIEDWPDFRHRGVMLDISRDKVPTMQTLYELVDLFAEWKLNQIQLYVEHTFAYKGHHLVWENASPMTPRQFRDLDAYCRERFIELVPNQNSFGHMGRWLQHERYAHLAEIWGSGDLCPVDPGSLRLLQDLYSQLLPNFTSGQFNVGCDETWSLGQGRSKEKADKIGNGRVYLDFLKQIHEEVSRYDRVMQFWGDIILNHEDLIPELPDNVIALAWGYEAEHPFVANARHFEQAGVRFYVVPGTSSWNAITGRTHNCVLNLQNAATNGRVHRAEGFLITDWGDNGHWQHLPISYHGFAYGAALAWCEDANIDLHLDRALDLHCFRDEAGVMGKILHDLGNAYRHTGVNAFNQTIFSALLNTSLDGNPKEPPFHGMSIENLKGTLSALEDSLKPLGRARMARSDAELIQAEVSHAAALARLACHLGTARLEEGNVGTAEIPAKKRHALAEELEPLVHEYRQLWMARNRGGGLRDSAGRMEKLLSLLKA